MRACPGVLVSWCPTNIYGWYGGRRRRVAVVLVVLVVVLVVLVLLCYSVLNRCD